MIESPEWWKKIKNNSIKCKYCNYILNSNKSNNTKIIEKAISNKKGQLFISGTGSSTKLSKKGKSKILVDKIDNIAKNKNIGLIKMDIEGSELSAIKGAKNTIINNHPTLLISVYHNPMDFFQIYPLLKKWVPKYKFKFANINHNHPRTEKILIAYKE